MNVFDPAAFLAGAPRLLHRVERPLPTFHDVAWEPHPPIRRPRARGVKRLGLMYEQRVIDVLSAIYGPAFRPAPAIRYRVGARPHLAIPDGILTLPQWTVIVEVKLAHTESVWEQLMERYLPLVRRLMGEARLRPVEICRSYDPALSLAGPHTVIDSLHRPPSGEGLEVMKWRI